MLRERHRQSIKKKAGHMWFALQIQSLRVEELFIKEQI